MSDRKEYYQKNKEKYRESSRTRKEKSKQFANKIKTDAKCLFCREDDFACLDFHHKDPNEKEIDISELIKNRAPPEKILKETNKCVVLCANCHRKLHHHLLPKA